MVGITVHKVD